jgi:hypothetical protein
MDREMEKAVQDSCREDLIALGRSSGVRGRRLVNAMDRAQKWDDLATRKKKLEPYLESMRDELPRDRSKWTREQKLLATQIVLLETADKSDVMQRGVEHIAKLWGLISTGKQDKGNVDEDTRELAEDMSRAAKEFNRTVKESVQAE